MFPLLRYGHRNFLGHRASLPNGDKEDKYTWQTFSTVSADATRRAPSLTDPALR
jgi:hypothetical protein